MANIPRHVSTYDDDGTPAHAGDDVIWPAAAHALSARGWTQCMIDPTLQLIDAHLIVEKKSKS